MDMEFPANSKTAKKKVASSQPKDKKKPEAEKLVSEPVTESKPGLGKRFKSIFLGSDFKGASSYIVVDVLFPAVRNMVVDATTQGVERFVYGEADPRGKNRPTSRGGTTYNRPVNRGGARPERDSRRGRPNSNQPTTNEIVLSSRADADDVIVQMLKDIDDYDHVSVADYRQMVGLPSTFVDNNWGWKVIDNL